MYQKIRTNLKVFEGGDGGLEMKLERLTAIVDQWRTGKTRWHRAVEFALTGGLPGGSKPKEIFELWAPPGAKELFAELHRDDGAMLQARIFKGENGFELVHNLPEDIRALPKDGRARLMPLTGAREVIQFGADKGRRELVLRFGEGVTTEAPPTLSEADRKLWAEAAKSVAKAIVEDKEKKRTLSGPADASEVLIGLQQHFDSLMRITTKEINNLEAETKGEVSAVAGAEQIPILEARADEAQRWQSAAELHTQRAANVTRRETTAKAKEDFGARKRLWNEQVAERSSKMGELHADITAADTDLAAAKLVLEQEEGLLANGRAYVEAAESALEEVRKANPGHALHDGTIGPCLFCGNQTLVVQLRKALGERVEARAGTTTIARREVEERQRILNLAQTALRAYQEQIANIEQSGVTYVEQLDREASQATAMIAANDQALAAMKVPTTYDGPTAEALREQIKALITAGEARKTYDEKLTKIAEKKAHHATMKRLKDGARERLTKLVETAAMKAEDRVARIAPPTLRMRFDKDEYAWQVFSIRDQRWHGRHTACGEELTWLILTVSVAYTDEAKDRLVLLDAIDLGEMDPRALASFEKDEEVQVLVAWTRSGEIPECFSLRNARGEATHAQPKLVVVGEAPGRMEVTNDRPLLPYGERLDVPSASLQRAIMDAQQAQPAWTDSLVEQHYVGQSIETMVASPGLGQPAIPDLGVGQAAFERAAALAAAPASAPLQFPLKTFLTPAAPAESAPSVPMVGQAAPFTLPSAPLPSMFSFGLTAAAEPEPAPAAAPSTAPNVPAFPHLFKLPT